MYPQADWSILVSGLAAAGGVIGGVWRMTRGVLQHIEDMRKSQTAEAAAFADRLEAAESRCVEQMSGITSQIYPVIEHNSAVVERCLAALSRHDRDERGFTFHAASQDIRMNTILDNPNGEPVYRIPPGEGDPEITVREDKLDSILDGTDRRDWGHPLLGIPELHAKGILGEGVIVAVLDTGCDVSHPGLAGMVVDARDYTRSPIGPSDRNGHGTHVASTIAEPNNGVGMQGVAPKARIRVAKVLSDSGSGLSSWIAQGFVDAVKSGSDICSASLGGPTPDSQTREAIDYAVENNVWVVAAAGNDGPGQSTSFPGNYPNVVCVAAVDNGLVVARFSSRNVQVDVAAPGVGIVAAYPGGRYASLSGTSMATPYVAGILALVRGELKKRNLPIPKLEVVMRLMKETARDLMPVGNDAASGAGLIQPAALLEAVLKEVGAGNPDVPPPQQTIVKVTDPALLAKGVESLTVAFKASPDAKPADGLFELPTALRVALRALLPILRRIADRSETPFDDLVLKIIEQVFVLKHQPTIVSSPYPEWLDYAGRILKSIMPFLKDLSCQTSTPIDDLVLDVLERLLGLVPSAKGVSSEKLRSTAAEVARTYRLIER